MIFLGILVIYLYLCKKVRIQNMRKLFTLMMFHFVWCALLAQTPGVMEYAYDAAGNRISKSAPWLQTASRAAAQSSSLLAQSEEVPLTGTISGTHSVSPTGAAMYSIPIPAIKGMSDQLPTISLTYNSQAGNGIAGYGWNLAGLSFITRGSKTIYFDEVATPTEMAADGAYYLNGTRLVCASGSPGTTGAVYFPETDLNTRVTVTESDTNGPVSFEVRTGDGTVCRYGGSSASRVSPRSGEVYVWALDDVEDRNGNYITYSYDLSYLNLYIREIGYGRNRNVIGGDSHRLVFTYEERPDPIHFRYRNDEGKVSKRLKSIRNDVVLSTYKRFDLTYEEGTYSHLVSITESGSDGTAYAPTTFYWNEIPDQRVTSNSVIVNSSSYESDFSKQYFFSSDINGDGRTDLVGVFPYERKLGNLTEHYTMVQYYPSQLGTATRFSPSVAFWLPADVNVDEQIKSYRAGNLSIHPEGNTRDWTLFPVFKKIGNSYEFGFYLLHPDGGSLIYGKSGYYEFGDKLSASSEVPAYAVGDLNNDGREEIVYLEKAAVDGRYEGKIIFLQFNASGNNLQVNPIGISLSCPSKPVRLLVQDFNGDGFPDILIAHETGYKIYWNRGGSLTHMIHDDATFTATTFNGKCDALETGDFNGDGLPDLLMNGENSTVWKLLTNAGNGTFSAQTLSAITAKCSNKKYYICQVTDLDGDGRSDAFISDGSKAYWCYSNGSTLNVKTQYAPTSLTYAPQCTHFVAGDFRGEGIATFVDYSYGALSKGSSCSWKEYRNYLRDVTNNKITVVTDGLKKNTRFVFASLLNSTGYEAEQTAVYPQVDARIALPVVEKIQDGDYTTQYQYAGGKIHLQGRGFLGFRSTTTKSARHTQILTNDFNTTYHVAYPVEERVKANSGAQLKATLYTSTFVSDGTKRFHIDRTTEQQINNATGDTCTVNTQFSRGIPNRSVTRYGNDLTVTRVTSLLHKQNADNWLIGLPQSVTETRENANGTWTDKENYTYNSQNQLTERITYTGDGTKKVKTERYTYTTGGKTATLTELLYESTDELTTTYTYSSNQKNLLTVTHPLGVKESYTYDKFGQVLTLKDEKNAQTSYTYDGMGRIVKRVLPDSTEVTTLREQSTVDGTAYCVTEEQTGQPTRKTWYDKFGREVRSGNIRFDGKTVYTVTTYGDLFDKPVSRSHPTSADTPSVITSYTYDIFDRLTRETDGSGSYHSYSYSGHNVTESSEGISQTRTYDAAGQLIRTSDPGGATVFTLRPDGQPSSVLAPGGEGARTTFTYDAWGRRTSIQDPSAGLHTYAYDTWGNLCRETDARNLSTAYTYDKYGRLLSKSRPEGTVSYTYDAYDLTKETYGSSVRSWTYDNLRRLTQDSETAPDNKKLVRHYTYANGNLSAVDYVVNGENVGKERHSYQRGWLKSVTFENSSYPDVPVWGLISENERGQTTGYFIGAPREYTYDAYGYLTAIKAPYEDHIPDRNYYFNHRTNNLDSCQIGTQPMVRYTYDNLNRLTAYGTNQITYNATGNLTGKNSVGGLLYPDASHPYAVKTLQLAGSKYVRPSEQQITYTSFSAPSSISEEGYVAQWSYNGAGERNRMTVTCDGAPVLTRYYLGGQYERDEKPDGTMEKLYIGGDYYTAHRVLVKTNSGSWSLYPIERDYLGNIVRVGSNKYEYTPWGRQRNPETGAGYYDYDNQPDLYLGRGYSSHEHLPWFGLIHMNGRLYDPALGRFLSPDPYVQMPDFSQSFNRYTYAMNNPMKYTDKSGEYLQFVIAGLVGGAINWFANGADWSWEGLAYFGLGAAGAEAIIASPQSAIFVGAGMGAGNSILSQGFNNGWENISFQQVAFDGIVSGAMAGACMNLLNPMVAPISNWASRIQSPLWRNLLVSECSGLPIDALFGALQSFNDPDTSVLEGMWAAVKRGFISNGISGLGAASHYSIENKVNIVTGKTTTVQGNYCVYKGIDPVTEEVKYVGITSRDPEIRWQEHKRSGTERAKLNYTTFEGLEKLLEIEARKMEQFFINKYGMQKNGGQLYNKKNSIAPKYWDQYGIK